jgi:3-(methylthio)propionyl---CoA ligase
MLGLMQSQGLLIHMLLEHAQRHHGDTEIVSRRVEGDIHRSNWATIARRAKQRWLGMATAIWNCTSV